MPYKYIKQKNLKKLPLEKRSKNVFLIVLF